MDIKVGDIVILKKPHPCGGFRWKVLRTGADIKIKCEVCGHEVMLPRGNVIKRIKSIEKANPQE